MDGQWAQCWLIAKARVLKAGAVRTPFYFVSFFPFFPICSSVFALHALLGLGADWVSEGEPAIKLWGGGG